MKIRSLHAIRRPVRTSLGAGAVLISVLGVAACGDDDDSAKDVDLPEVGEVRLVSPGDAEGNGKPVTVAPAYGKGQQGTMDLTMTMGIDLDGGGQSIDTEVGVSMTMSQKVVEVSGGESTLEMTLDTIDVDAPEGADQSQLDSFTGLAGTTIVGTYDERGVQVGDITVKGGGSLPSELEGSLNEATNQAVFPDEPISVGATWTTRDQVDANGTMIDVATTYELVDYSPDEYVLKVIQDQPVSAEVGGADLDGTVSAEGEIRGHPENPLMMNMTYGQKSDFDIDVDGESGSMSMTLDMEITSR